MGYVHIYTGAGKGKSTAAVGLAVRAVGSGLRVAFYEFLKSGDSGEIKSLKQLGVDVATGQKGLKFVWDMTTSEKQACAKSCKATLESAFLAMDSYNLVVLDEALGALHEGMISREALYAIMDRAKSSAELVLTGRNACDDSDGAELKALYNKADYVSVIACERHPFSKGISARKGIEY